MGLELPGQVLLARRPELKGAEWNAHPTRSLTNQQLLRPSEGERLKCQGSSHWSLRQHEGVVGTFQQNTFIQREPNNFPGRDEPLTAS